MSQAWPAWRGTLRQRSGGWNNTTYFVESGERRAVLRIYDTHKDRSKIQFEHVVLQKLQALNLPFRIPVPIVTAAGETIAQLVDGSGKFACLFAYIEGESPSVDNSGYYESFGEAAGTLSAALAEVEPGIPAVYRPYYELRTSYPLCTPEAVHGLVRDTPEPLQELLPQLQILVQAYDNVADSLGDLERLPHQLVHGDLNASNLLVEGADATRVAALLDFEFCTRDVRVMDAAVILSALQGLEDSERVIRDFWRGYNRKVTLTPEEQAAIPVLMLLRKIDVFLHFVTRYWEGTDEVNVLQQQVRELAAEVAVM